MKAEKTQWYLPAEVQTSFGVETDAFDRQPGFGFSIAWNQPWKLWKPFIAINIWRWFIQLGWLVD